jgi:hypothetical protein
MDRSLRLASLLFAALLAGPPARAASEGVSSPFSVAIVVDGRPVREYAARGRVYVEAIRGREFVVRLANSSPFRVAVALSVDGRNVIDARRTTAAAAAKWILGPGQSVDIPGWQVSGDTARRFFFTETSKSYARWLGDTANVGTIEAVFFRERCRPQPLERGRLRKDESTREQDATVPAAPVPEAGASRNRTSRQSAAAERYAATGIGDRTSFPVTRIAFDQDPAPAARIALRYEFRSELVRLGVLPRGEEDLFARDDARGFEYGYAPDPYRQAGPQAR